MQNKTTSKHSKDKNQEAINKLQGKKFVTDLNKWALLTIVKNSPLNTKYRKSLSCMHTIDFDHKSAISCHRRWCSICESKKMAKMIDKYLPQLEQKNKLYFVTLTAQTVGKNKLPQRLKDISEIWRAITKYNRIHLKQQFNGIRKLEITIAENNKYHAHLHILMDNHETALWLKSQWLKHWKKRTGNSRIANYKAQDIRKVTNAADALIELSKYVAKALNLDRETDKKGAKIIVTEQKKDWIYQCLMKGKIRTFSHFGDIKATKILAKELDQLETKKPKSFSSNTASWQKGVHNWASKEGELLGTNDLKKEKELFKSQYEHYEKTTKKETD